MEWNGMIIKQIHFISHATCTLGNAQKFDYECSDCNKKVTLKRIPLQSDENEYENKY